MKKVLMLGAVVPVMFLTACGDGYEMRPYNNTPYGNRTAGSGVEYVRAMMMPEKGTKVPDEIVVKEPEIKPEPKKTVVVKERKTGAVDKMLNSGEKFFRDLQKK